MGWPYDDINLPDVTTGPTGPSGAMANVGKNLPTNAASRANFGVPTTITGTGSQPAPTSANLLSSLSRTIATGTAGSAQGAGWRSEIAFWWRGNAPGLGGFHMRWRIATPTMIAAHAAFVGFCDLTTELPNIQPSALTNILGMGIDGGTSRWAIMHNDAAGPATTVDLGPAFALSTTSLFSLELVAAANDIDVDWIARNVSTGAIATGTIAANLPASTTFLSQHERVWTLGDATTAPTLGLYDIVSVLPGP